ncbi:unnamed protein product [Rotaria socialis]|uniref:Uncharacterized protein n=2 Tax=Rotaria socialis TaxID=392032 RepID=A0A818S893_9BILA|nr:unnamed protein product [Rotaria socialis]
MSAESRPDVSYTAVPTNEPSRPRNRCTYLLVGTIIILLICGAIGYFLLRHERRKETIHTQTITTDDDTQDLCTTPECIQAAHALLESIDETVDPCENFYQFSCGKWIKNAKIPAENSKLNSLSQMKTNLQNALVDLLSSSPINERTEPKAIINARRWYNSCINESAIEEEGVDVILSFINKELGGWPILLGDKWDGSTFDPYRVILTLSQYNHFMPYRVETTIDLKNSSLRSIRIKPSIDLTVNLIPTTVDLEKTATYLAIFQKFAAALAKDSSTITIDTLGVLKLELRIQLAYLRSQILSLNIVLRASIGNLALANFLGHDFINYVESLYRSANVYLMDTDIVTVIFPEIIHAITSIFEEESPRTVQNFLIWHFMIDQAWKMPKKFRDLEQQYRRLFDMISEEKARTVRCAEYLGETMGPVISMTYTNKYFNKDSRKEPKAMVNNIRDVFINMVNRSTWMDSHSKTWTIKKVQDIKSKVGYPDYFENAYMIQLEKQYADYNFNSSLMLNALKLIQLNSKNSLRTLRDPVDKDEWMITLPTTLTATYHILLNDITIPAAFLQKPLFSNNLPKYINYGGIGFVIGHEMVHGFDDDARRYDMHGNEFSLWTNMTIEAFHELKQCIVDQYNSYTLAQVNQQVKGERTKDENLADIVGLKLAFYAYRKWAQSHRNVDKKLPGLTKYSAEQIFFLSFGHAWCEKMSNAAAESYLIADIHSPPEFRVIGSTSNFVEFDQSFDCKPSQRNSRVDKCNVCAIIRPIAPIIIKITTNKQLCKEARVLVAIQLREFQIYMRMSNVMGKVEWNTTHVCSTGSLTLTNTGQRSIFFSLGLQKSIFQVEQGIVGGTLRLKHLRTTTKMAICDDGLEMLTHESAYLETFHLVWLDTTENESYNEKMIARQQLRTIFKHLKIFKNPNECQEYMENMTNTDRIVLIVDGQSSQQIIPRVHELRQVSSIYVYESNDDALATFRLSQKIKAVSAEFDCIRTQLVSDHQHRTRRRYQEVDEPISISIFNTSLMSDQSSTGLNGQFMFSHLLIDILLRMPSTDTDKNELIALFEEEFSGNLANLATLNEFKQTYSSKQALLWYTKESFLYRLLNKALRVQNIDLLFLFRFFIHDIHQQLQQLRCSSPIRVYRGQAMSIEELNVLQSSIGQLISMNSFLSTSANRDLALFYLGNSTALDASPRVLFEIDADPRLDSAMPFANITAHSHFPDEEEILMMLGSIFRIESIQHQREKDSQLVHIVRMTLCSDNNHNAKLVYETMKSELGVDGTEKTSLLHFGDALNEMGKFNVADKYFHRLLYQLPNNHADIAHCYHGLGEAATGKGEYEASLEWLHKALEIRIQTLPSDHDDIGQTHNCIGISFEGQGEYNLALESYGRALTIWQLTKDKNYHRVAWCLNNIGVVYQKEKKYTESLEYQQKSLSIKEKNLPTDHPDIAASLHNIGDAYCSLGQHDTALEYYERALNIFRKSLPDHHPHIAYTLGSIGHLSSPEM